MQKKSVSTKTVSVLIFGLCAWMNVNINVNLNHKKMAFTPPADVAPFIWQPDLYKILSFGNVPSAVDALLLKFLVEDNIQHVEKGVTARVYYFLDLATDLDPAFFSLYTAGANFLAVIRNDKQAAFKLISKGETFRKNELPKYPESFRDAYWGDQWRIPFIKGYVYLFELGNITGAAEAYGELDKIVGAPPILRGMAQHFARSGGIYEIGQNVLKNMISNEEDVNVRSELQLKQKSFSLSFDLFKLNEQFKAYKGTWAQFKKEKKVPETDVFGGKVFLDANGKINTTTERMEVLGIR